MSRFPILVHADIPKTQVWVCREMPPEMVIEGRVITFWSRLSVIDKIAVDDDA